MAIALPEDRTLRALLRGWGLAALLVLGQGTASLADPWIDGFAEGVNRAREDGRLLVLVFP